MTALENVQVGTEISDAPMAPTDALRLVELADRADHFPGQLSGGQQHNGAIARIADRAAYIRDGALHDLRVNQTPQAVEEVTWLSVRCSASWSATFGGEKGR